MYDDVPMCMYVDVPMCVPIATFGGAHASRLCLRSIKEKDVHMMTTENKSNERLR